MSDPWETWRREVWQKPYPAAKGESDQELWVSVDEKRGIITYSDAPPTLTPWGRVREVVAGVWYGFWEWVHDHLPGECECSSCEDWS